MQEQTEDNSSPSRKRRVAGDFEISTHKIGKGSYGEVYLGWRMAAPSELVAVKAVPHHGNPNTLALHELRHLYQFQKDPHPYILKLLDRLMNSKFILIITEYCEGGDLEGVLAHHKTGLEESTVRRLFKQLVSGLVYLSDKNVLHRDLKPANLLLTKKDLRDAEIRIADLGFAKLHPANQNAALSARGTPLYQSPERLRGEKYNFEAEVWAAGRIFYEMLFGVLPFEASDENEWRAQVRENRVLFPREIDESCKSLIRGMLKDDPSERMTIHEVQNHPWLAISE